MKTKQFDDMNKALGKSLKQIIQEQKNNRLEKIIKSGK